jgi:hypothetical protein
VSCTPICSSQFVSGLKYCLYIRIWPEERNVDRHIAYLYQAQVDQAQVDQAPGGPGTGGPGTGGPGTGGPGTGGPGIGDRVPSVSMTGQTAAANRNPSNRHGKGWQRFARRSGEADESRRNREADES